ncbi:MAG: PEP-CTERM sorting domain-containing protein [Phycisphaerales bacterium]|nr:PEP-CTERM sorting domain-containing protein [Phycisphaerales bacterium]
MKTVSILAIAGIAAAASAQHAQWYNGDPDLVNGLSAEFNTSPVTDAYVFDDFDWNGGTIFDIGGNFLSSTNITGYAYEIRSGMSNGFGGTLHASGDTDGAYTKTPNGFDAFGFTGYHLVADVPDSNLSPGKYFLALSEKGDGTGRAFVATTSGAGSNGTPGGNNDNSFFYSTYFGVSYGPARDQFGTNSADFSYGINHVPAPASAALLGLGALVARRRR